MTRFDEARVRHVADLARLALTPEEEARFARELADVCNAFEGLPTAAETGGREDEGASVATRADEVDQSDEATRELILAAFPRKEGRFAKVPRGL